MLLHDVADRLNIVADHLPLLDQIRPDPALSEILDDEVRHLARLLGFLVGEHAFRHRAADRYPHQTTATLQRVSLALASAAEPTGAALAALASAVTHLGHLTDLARQAPGRDRDGAITGAHQTLVDRIGESRAQLARAAKHLRSSADTRTASDTSATPGLATPSTRASRSR
ncbi:hypothetical protein [Streptomyces pseudovenezuelae]|uniref:hypothetical protein n=1 Tax=Streptomyces pseudovenezuelae TaxID=67350 RepID=UPI002E8215BC|nr:hypothetical protein [Streptomyces pseudovenezuelae]WUA87590.1 hypothetical protein OHO81_09965 [Streptomyces pseudovenezuelae]